MTSDELFLSKVIEFTEAHCTTSRTKSSEETAAGKFRRELLERRAEMREHELRGTPRAPQTIQHRKPWALLQANLRELCDKHGSKKELAGELGISASKLSRILNDRKSQPRAEIALALKEWADQQHNGLQRTTSAAISS